MRGQHRLYRVELGPLNDRRMVTWVANLSVRDIADVDAVAQQEIELPAGKIAAAQRPAGGGRALRNRDPLAAQRFLQQPDVAEREVAPVTQADFGDATGLTNVHVNRTLRELRLHGVVKIQAGTVTVLDWDRMVKVGDFDQAFLLLN